MLSSVSNLIASGNNTENTQRSITVWLCLLGILHDDDNGMLEFMLHV